MLRRTQQLPLIYFFLFLLFSGCNQQEKSVDTISHSDTIEQQQADGPLTVRMQLPAGEINPADNLILTLTATTPEDYVVSFPDFATTAGDFDVVDTTLSPKKLSNSLVTQNITFSLSPFLPGEYSTPEIKITASVPDNDSSLVEVIFSPQTITVISLLQGDEESPSISDIYEPLSLPIPIWYFIVAGLVLLFFIAIAFFLMRRKRKHTKIIPLTPPHITALEAIDTLLSQKTDTEHSLFFAKLSLILRHYIEERFGLKAPEQTTEEFVTALGNTPMFSNEHKELLKNFLHHSDLIKFAQMTPTEVEIMGSVESCRNFVQATGEKPGGAP